MLDTSDDYGQSEAVIGQYLRKNTDKQFTICTKFSASRKGNSSLHEALRNFARKACEKLSISQIPIFMSHTERDYFAYGSELVDALKYLKEEGLIQNAAISIERKDCLEEIVASGAFDAIQLPLNLLDNKVIRDGLIKKASDSGIAVFVRSVYLQGLFFRDPQTLKNTQFDAAAPLVERIHRIAEREGLTPAQLALSFIRDTEGVDSLVIGSETAAQVSQNIEMFHTPVLSKTLRDNLLSDFEHVDPFVISPWEWSK